MTSPAETPRPGRLRCTVLRVVLAAGVVSAAAPAQADAQAPHLDADWWFTQPIPAEPFPAAGELLSPARYRYDVLVTGDSGTSSVGTHTITIAEGRFSGRPAWSVVEHRQSFHPFAGTVAVDTVLLSRESLLPLRWDALAGDARFVAAFTNDSVYGGATAPNARRTFTIASAPVTLTSEGALDAVLMAAPLQPGWVADVSMLVADLGGARLVPLHMAVERDERIVLPVGQFDTWVVRATAGVTDRVLWVDKRTGAVLRTAMNPAHMPGMLVERVLTHQP